MKKSIILSPSFERRGSVTGNHTIADLARETSLFSCDMELAEKNAGDLTQDILNTVKGLYKDDMKAAYKEGLNEVIDVRVQRLMPGMYPSIPGWHCDAVPRANYFAQPDFSKINPASFHVTCILDTAKRESGFPVSSTQFYTEYFKFDYDDEAPVWQQLHKNIEAFRQDQRDRFGFSYSKTAQIKAGDLIKFSSMTPHRAMPCNQRGWRLFFRMSMYHKPALKGEINAQQQVYVLSEGSGW